MDAYEYEAKSTNRRRGDKRGVPWLDNVEQHRVCSALPYIECIRAFELGDPYRIKVIQRIRIPT